ncbi:MAG TPA: hypothetical protein VGE97_07005 [Nitrososphaera sp.]|jgi:uncharacterized membrane protein
MVYKYHWKDGARFLILGMLLLMVNIAVVPASAQEQRGYTSDSLFIALFATGDALVEYNVGIVDPQADEIRIKLFGDDVSNLIVGDYEDNVIPFETGAAPNEVVLHNPGASNLKISYTTSHFLSKDRREWIFALNSTINFSVKLPPDSILTDPGPNPSIALVGDQQLLTYKPGNVSFVYVIGTLGTEEQANIVINAAETTIVQVNGSFPGIVLASAKDLLQKATVARDGGKFTDAEKLADQANDQAIAAGRDFDSAQKALTNAEAQINMASMNGSGDNPATRQMLEVANNEFASGNYIQAKNSADAAVTAIGEVQPQSNLTLPLIVVAAIGGAGGGTMLYFLKRRHQKLLPQINKTEETDLPDKKNNETAELFQPPNPSTTQSKDIEHYGALEDHQHTPGSGEETSITQMPTMISDSQIDRTALSQIVAKILEDKPDLRPEDRQVLDYLVEKEGAAFESEIRSKFQLPKTTIWRLVKRLEREELVEIRKAGGQNLIKLRFEDMHV